MTDDWERGAGPLQRMSDSDIDSLSADGAQESPVRQYRVDVQSDRWDPDSVRHYLFVWAHDPNEAGNLALRDFPAGRIRFVDDAWARSARRRRTVNPGQGEPGMTSGDSVSAMSPAPESSHD